MDVSEKSEKSESIDSTSSRKDAVEQTLKEFERRAENLISRFEYDLLPNVGSDREKLNNSLITAFGVGFVIGMIFGGLGRGRR